ncbi:MAG: acetyl-CoA carboxylase biotin carboxyl carrier protein subunit [Deltaproteobacteria bacterium]|nr:acetyl-CoA carboxylase biotin carboxyl carrier protein subunit [Deltaproteobacteria bacterium]
MTEIKSPAVGVVLEVLVSAGDAVTAEQELVVVESMKIEIPVVAPRAGTVSSVAVERGAHVKENDVVLTLD